MEDVFLEKVIMFFRVEDLFVVVDEGRESERRVRATRAKPNQSTLTV
jgi:hypothetical protein